MSEVYASAPIAGRAPLYASKPLSAAPGGARRLVLLATRATLFVQVQEFLCRMPFLCKAPSSEESANHQFRSGGGCRCSAIACVFEARARTA